MAHAASRSTPSNDRRGPCRLDLGDGQRVASREGGWLVGGHTKANPRIFLTHAFALLIGEEHVGRETALGRVGVYAMSIRARAQGRGVTAACVLTFLLLLDSASLGLGGAFCARLRHGAGGRCCLGWRVGGWSAPGTRSAGWPISPLWCPRCQHRHQGSRDGEPGQVDARE